MLYADATMINQVPRLLKASEQVIRDCSLPNGAIVASNSSKAYFPKQAKNYMFVWPRDAMYACFAARILGIEIQERFFRWCMKAEGWGRTGLFYEKYHVNGRQALHHFQPDQTASVLIALHDCYKDRREAPKEFKSLIRKSANGLCRVWQKDHFSLPAQDLWEERLCFPDLRENFTYSLAACCRGLLSANELIPSKRWVKTANDMKRALLDNSKNRFHRSFGKISDMRVDASLLGLVFPFRIVKPADKRMQETVRLIEDRITKDFRVYRYEHDEYDGWMYKENTHRMKGAGYWPLLNFWMSIYYLERGKKARALKYYKKVLGDVKSNYIPEQIFGNSTQVSVSPLCWSHAMFVIATKKLGYV
jgi:GH15 family glucan-1,4-alpha-glucosidase